MWWLALGCGPADPCGAGTHLEGETCVADPDTDVDTDAASAVDALGVYPPCDAANPDSTIDLVGGCMDGVCLGMDAASADAAAGGLDCVPSAGFVLCFAPNGLIVELDDEDGDGAADDDAHVFLVQALDPFFGTTDAGVGVGVSMACVVEAYGEPDEILWDRGVEGTLWPVRLAYDEWYVSFTDQQDASLDFNGDGLIEGIVLLNSIWR